MGQVGKDSKRLKHVAIAAACFIVPVVVCLIFTSGIKHLAINTDVLRDLPENLPARRIYEKMTGIFPSREIIFVVAEAHDGNIYTKKNLSIFIGLPLRGGKKAHRWSGLKVKGCPEFSSMNMVLRQG